MGRNDSEAPAKPALVGELEAASVAETLEGQMDKLAFFDSVRTMNETAKACGILEHEGSPASKDSLKTYTRIWKRDQEARTGLEGVSGRSWYVHRAALRWGLSESFRKLKTAQGQAQRRGDFEVAEEIVREAQETLERWKALETAEKPQRAPRSRSKRSDVPRDLDWQQRVWKATEKEHRAAVAVVWATGCRPAELAKGVEIREDQDGDLVVTINGAKVSERTKAGQPERQVTVSRYSIPGMLLGELVNKGPVMVSIDRRKLERVLEKAGKMAGLKKRLSAYTFRHQFAAEMKVNGDQEATAQALGHVSGKSSSRYGHHRQAKAGSIVSVKASEPVRHVTQGYEVRASRLAGMEL